MWYLDILYFEFWDWVDWWYWKTSWGQQHHRHGFGEIIDSSYLSQLTCVGRGGQINRNGYHLVFTIWNLWAGCKIPDQDEIDDLYDQRVSSVIQGRQPSFVPLPTIVRSDHMIIFKRNIICNIDIGWQSVEWNDISDDDPEYFWCRVETSHWSRLSRYCALIGWYQYHSVTTPAL